jgi:hypothetical protein
MVLMLAFSMRREFPMEWYRFFHPVTAGGEQVLSFTVGSERFPFFAQERLINVMKIDVFAKCARAGDYQLLSSHDRYDQSTAVSSQITAPQNDSYAGLNKATINVSDAGLISKNWISLDK